MYNVIMKIANFFYKFIGLENKSEWPDNWYYLKHLWLTKIATKLLND